MLLVIFFKKKIIMSNVNYATYKNTSTDDNKLIRQQR